MGTDATMTDVPSAAVEADGGTGVAAGGVLIRLGASRYVVAMADVAEVAPVPDVTRVPGAPPWLSGVANWRGRMLPVLDLRPLLGASTIPLPGSARLVVLTRDDVVVGLVSEAVPGVYDGQLAEMAAPPPTLAADAVALVVGQVADRSGPVAVLDAGAVLALRDRVVRRRHGS
jgi:chemotaxis signal transduction protein